MNCLVCDVSCDGKNQSLINTNRKKYIELIADLAKVYLILKINETDLILCKPCLILLDELYSYRCKAKLLEELLTRQTLRTHNIIDSFGPSVLYKLSIDSEAKRYFIHQNNFYSCRICVQFKTLNTDSMAPHYKYHEINGDDLDVTLGEEATLNMESLYTNLYENNEPLIIDDDPYVNNDIDNILNETIVVNDENNTNPFTSSMKSDLYLNLSTPANKTILKCFICKYETIKKEEIVSHMSFSHAAHKRINFLVRKHNPKKKYCDKCGMANRRRDNCDHMVAIIKNYKELPCILCNILFFGKEMLLDHYTKVHFTCYMCDKKFTNSKGVYMHLYKMHTGEMYTCDLCSKPFKSRGGLQYHMSSHTGNFKFKCQYCGKGVHTTLALKDHISKHTKEELYVCDICGQKFRHFGSFSLHKRWHQNPLPFPCTECPKKFSTSSFRLVHIRQVHTKDPVRYICELCNKHFVLKSSLNMHMQKHTGNYKYNCTKCSAGFCRKSSYAEHMVKKHNDHSVTKRVIQYKIALRPEKVSAKKVKLEVN